MEIFVMDGIMQPYIMMLFRGVSPGEDESVEDAAQRLLAIVKQTIEKLASDGFSKKDLEASINRLDFRFREYPEPQGLYRANAVFNSWLYGGDPSLYLRTNEAVAALREMAETDAYEKLASKLIGDVSKYSSLILTPDTGLEAAQAKLEADRIAAAIDAMDSRERKALEDLNEDLLRWQQTPDPAEDIAKIPMLRLSDIDPMPEIIATEEKTVEGVRVLFHPVQTNGIVYINAYFPVTQLSAEDLPKAALITDLLKDLPTSDHDVLALQSEMKMHVGSISFGLDILSSDGETAVCTPCIRVRASVLEEKLSHAEDLITEILTRTSFDDISLLRELMKQIDEDGKRGAVTSGHRLALYEARSHWSARDAATEAVSGYSFLQFMHGMADASDEELRAFSGSAAGIIAESISRQNVIISVTSTEYADVSRLISMLPEGQAMPEVMSLSSPLPRRMGIQIPAAVSFSVTAYEMLSDGSRMNGNMSVAANIISLAQLWNEIRVQGGAYGAAMSAGRTGTLFCYTYRDPSPSRSLGIYRTIPDFISAFAASEDADIDGFIISTIASTEPLLSPAAKGRAADDFFISGFTDEDRIRFRREMLETTPSDLAAQREALERMAARGTVCVVGPKAALEGCEGLEVFEL